VIIALSTIHFSYSCRKKVDLEGKANRTWNDEPLLLLLLFEVALYDYISKFRIQRALRFVGFEHEIR